MKKIVLIIFLFISFKGLSYELSEIYDFNNIYEKNIIFADSKGIFYIKGDYLVKNTFNDKNINVICNLSEYGNIDKSQIRINDGFIFMYYINNSEVYLTDMKGVFRKKYKIEKPEKIFLQNKFEFLYFSEELFFINPYKWDIMSKYNSDGSLYETEIFYPESKLMDYSDSVYVIFSLNLKDELSIIKYDNKLCTKNFDINLSNKLRKNPGFFENFQVALVRDNFFILTDKSIFVINLITNEVNEFERKKVINENTDLNYLRLFSDNDNILLMDTYNKKLYIMN